MNWNRSKVMYSAIGLWVVARSVGLLHRQSYIFSCLELIATVFSPTTVLAGYFQCLSSIYPLTASQIWHGWPGTMLVFVINVFPLYIETGLMLTIWMAFSLRYATSNNKIQHQLRDQAMSLWVPESYSQNSHDGTAPHNILLVVKSTARPAAQSTMFHANNG